MSKAPEQRTEFRVIGERRGEAWWGRPRETLTAATREAQELSGGHNSRVRVQKRTVIETPWEDVPDAPE